MNARFGRTAVAAFFFSCLLALTSAAEENLTHVAKKLAKGADALPSKKVAVLAFPYADGKMSSGSSIISERLTTDLVGKGQVRVIERRLISKILQEKNLSETGVIDEQAAKDIGTVLGVDALVTGTLIDLENGKTEINARMINAQSGEILSAVHSTVDRTWTDAPIRPRAPVVKKEAPAPEIVEEGPAPRPAHSGKTLKLSNESFPPGRRLYHSNHPAPPKKGKYSGESPARTTDEEEDNDSDDDRGYQEARDDSRRETGDGRLTPKNPPEEEPSFAARHVENFKKDLRYRKSGTTPY